MIARMHHPFGPAMFHSRWGTGGTEDLANCHPFTVGRDTQTVVAHNGVLFSVSNKEARSDTAIFAEKILPRMLRRIDRPGKREKLESYLGYGNKIAVITVNPKYRRSAYLFNEDMGYWDAGEWHSNSDYRTPVYAGKYSPFANWSSDDYRAYGQDWTVPALESVRDDCWSCLSKRCVDIDTYVCTVCHVCVDCGESDAQCLCYYPAADRALQDESDSEVPAVLDGLVKGYTTTQDRK